MESLRPCWLIVSLISLLFDILDRYLFAPCTEMLILLQYNYLPEAYIIEKNCIILNVIIYSMHDINGRSIGINKTNLINRIFLRDINNYHIFFLSLSHFTFLSQLFIVSNTC